MFGGVKRTSFELSGNAPFIVFHDADLNTAVDAYVVKILVKHVFAPTGFWFNLKFWTHLFPL